MAIQIPYTDSFITPAGGSNIESKTNKGQANGYAPLDANAKVPLANLPDHTHSISEVTSLQATLTAFAIALG